MCRLSSTLFFLTLHIFSSSARNKYNVSLETMSTCKEHIMNNRTYAYSDFIDISLFMNNPKAGKELVHIKLIVMTKMAAHILLSEQNNPSRTDWVYEFVLGGWKNEFSAYRLQLSGAWLWQKPSNDLLGEFDPMPIEVIQNSDGLVSINIPGKKRFLYYFDKIPLNIKYVAFSAHDTAKYSRWYYDCQFDDSAMSKIDQTIPFGPNIVNSGTALPQQSNSNSTANIFNYFINVY